MTLPQEQLLHRLIQLLQLRLNLNNPLQAELSLELFSSLVVHLLHLIFLFLETAACAAVEAASRQRAEEPSGVLARQLRVELEPVLAMAMAVTVIMMVMASFVLEVILMLTVIMTEQLFCCHQYVHDSIERCYELPENEDEDSVQASDPAE